MVSFLISFRINELKIHKNSSKIPLSEKAVVFLIKNFFDNKAHNKNCGNDYGSCYDQFHVF